MGQMQQKLDAIRENFLKKAPDDIRKTMRGVVEALQNSGKVEQALGVGGSFPRVQLLNSGGETRDLDPARGPWVITFFRGHW